MIIKLTKCRSFAKAVISDTLLAAKTCLGFIFCIFLGSLSGVGSSLTGKKVFLNVMLHLAGWKNRVSDVLSGNKIH